MTDSTKTPLAWLAYHTIPPRYARIRRRVEHFGLRYKCPLCRSRLSAFLPHGIDAPILNEKRVVGGGYRDGALCPVCNAIDRERLLYLYLARRTDTFVRPQKILHVAPERTVVPKLRANKALDYLTADIASPHVMARMDITDIQFPDNTFDAIICNHVLEHIVDDGKAMSELYRTLKPGGWAILQVPISLTLKETFEDSSITTMAGRLEVFGQNDHVRIYGADYVNRLARVGFEVEVFNWLADWANFGGKRNLFGLNEEEKIYIGHKRR